MTIPESFAMLMARCMLIFSPGDGLEAHFQASFWISWGVPHPMKCWFSLHKSWGEQREPLEPSKPPKRPFQKIATKYRWKPILLKKVFKKVFVDTNPINRKCRDWPQCQCEKTHSNSFQFGRQSLNTLNTSVIYKYPLLWVILKSLIKFRRHSPWVWRKEESSAPCQSGGQCPWELRCSCCASTLVQWGRGRWGRGSAGRTPANDETCFYHPKEKSWYYMVEH